ncbi:MAG: DOPA 4,5-dioxygenase family protein [Leptolyngbya sp. SIO1D8]|nr:DOPA 4,5-dioxygenase family protein [Leptolyngbya sp. SIO1D8]
MSKRPENRYSRYHAHVYFDEHTVEQATSFCTAAGEHLGIGVGKVHCKRVGPHPHWSCQLSFTTGQFEAVIPWLERHRGGLNILVHGLTGDDLADHTEHAAWLGEPQSLVLGFFEGK